MAPSGCRPATLPRPAGVIWARVVQIGCPQCQTHYALDDRLVPPGGAPVQCTRCGHVFIAYRPGDAPAADSQSKGGAPAPAPPPRTKVFGGTPPGRTPPAVSPTPAFGTTNAPPGPSSVNQTQVFGGLSPDAVATPPPPEAGRTQVFGGAAAPPEGAPAPQGG